MGLTIVPEYDNSASAPPGFVPAVEAAVAFWESQIADPVTITIDFGWGETDGSPIGRGNLASNISGGVMLSYAQLSSDLAAVATSPADMTAVASLPAVDPSGGGSFFVTDAQAKVLGIPGDNAPVDGYVGLSSSTPFTYPPAGRAVPGDYDAVGALEHEISEVLGRLGFLSTYFADGQTGVYGPMDLFRYTAAAASPPLSDDGSFSINNGQTLLTAFNNPQDGGDVADWTPSLMGDSFGDGYRGVEGLVTATDIEVMDVIGWTLTPAATLDEAFSNVLRADPTSTLATTPTITLADGASVANPIYLDAQTLPTLASQVAGGDTLAQVLNAVEHYGDATTSVATLAYQFFTGATPTSAGYDYLINSPSNPDNLNSAYYAQFNEENRYINFAVNLGGAGGAGAASFLANYGSLSLADAMTQAYTAIFGFAPAAGKIDAILTAEVGTNETRADYFAAYGLDAIGTKAAAVGWLMVVAVEGDLGTYAQANDQFLTALANGTEQYNVNLLSVYAAPSSQSVATVGAAAHAEAAHGLA